MFPVLKCLRTFFCSVYIFVVFMLIHFNVWLYVSLVLCWISTLCSTWNQGTEATAENHCTKIKLFSCFHHLWNSITILLQLFKMFNLLTRHSCFHHHIYHTTRVSRFKNSTYVLTFTYVILYRKRDMEAAVWNMLVWPNQLIFDLCTCSFFSELKMSRTCSINIFYWSCEFPSNVRGT